MWGKAVNRYGGLVVGGTWHSLSGAVYSSVPPVLAPACCLGMLLLRSGRAIAYRARTPSHLHSTTPEDGPFKRAPCPAVVYRYKVRLSGKAPPRS